MIDAEGKAAEGSAVCTWQTFVVDVNDSLEADRRWFGKHLLLTTSTRTFDKSLRSEWAP